jgi:hypothetical protein
MALLLAAALGIRNDAVAQATGNKPSQMADQADALLRTGLRDNQVRTEALWLYQDVLDSCTSGDAECRPLMARAHLGLGLINTFDFFDLLPALSSLLGIDITSLLGSLSAAAAPAAAPAVAAAGGGEVWAAGSCSYINIRDYLLTLDEMLSNMLAPSAEHFAAARALDPGVTLTVEDAWVMLAPDDPATPEDESIVLDLSGEWDAADAALFEGVFDALVGGVKIVMSYDGPIQQLVNSSLTPGCAPAPGGAEWTSLFGPYGPLTDGGAERMGQAQERLATGLSALAESFRLFTAETDDQSDDLLRYYDVGKDGLGPGDPGYPGPDADGSEDNGAYDVGEPWGMESVGGLLNSLLGGLLGGLPMSLSDLSKMLPPAALADMLDSMGDSAENGTPVDLIPTLLKPLLGALGLAGTDQELYAQGLPALNLGALFIPPLPDISVIMPLTDASGVTITEPEAGDTSHTWPDGSGRVDPPNGTVDPAYSFYPDQDGAGNDVGVMGGLILNPVTTPADFDGAGNLIGTVDYEPMMNPRFNSLMGLLGSIMP